MAGESSTSGSSSPRLAESKPLLKRGGSSKYISTRPKRKHFPTRQLFFLALVRLSEPIVFTSIFPYVYFMIKSFGVAKDDSQIAVYASLITSAFTVAEFSTAIFWGHISDKYGRKPVLIIGLIGTLISILTFGLATSFPMAFLARVLGGALNGNMGVIQTTVAELTDGNQEWQSKGFAVMAFVWCLGAILGPMIGGLLAEPATRHPDWFDKDGIFGQFPYFLPGLVCSGILVFGIVIGWLFLEETHEELGKEPDLGRRIGEKIFNVLLRPFRATADFKQGIHAEENAAADEYTSYDTFIPPSVLAGADDALPVPRIPTDNEDLKAAHKPTAFTWPVIHTIVSMGILAFHTIQHDQLFPVFLSTPRGERPHSLLYFNGGFGYTTSQVGAVMSIQGLLSLLAQFIYPPTVKRWGAALTYRTVMQLYPLAYFVVPFLLFLPRGFFETAGIYLAVCIKIGFGTLAYPGNAIILTNTVESPLVLGRVNGATSSTAAGARTIGPVLGGMLYAIGAKHGIIGLAWWVTGTLSILGGWQVIAFGVGKHMRNDEDDEDEE